ncbi:MAG: hypothetical protein H6983_26360 [Ectothiorhodospiraceae bacterium]|nr:hypothetical protein [Ectothiorhodospiraceae bacterium]
MSATADLIAWAVARSESAGDDELIAAARAELAGAESADLVFPAGKPTGDLLDALDAALWGLAERSTIIVLSGTITDQQRHQLDTRATAVARTLQRLGMVLPDPVAAVVADALELPQAVGS